MAGKILIVDDISTNRIVLRVKLSAAYYDVLQAKNGREAMSLVASECPDLVMLSAKLPDMDGHDLCARWKAEPATADMPVMIITPTENREARLAALRSGAEEVMPRPLDDILLQARLRSLLRARDTAQELRMRDCTYRALGFAEDAASFELAANVALAGDSRAMAIVWKQALETTLSARFTCHDPKGLMRDISEGARPDVVLVALDPETRDSGLRLLSELRANPDTRHSELMVILKQENRALAADALDLGANEILTNGFDTAEIALRIAAMVRRKRRADRLRDSFKDGLQAAMLDPLTGIYNRRYAMPALGRIAESAQGRGRGYAVMLADLDHFKQVNDSYGHAAGDAVLIEVAKRIKDALRSIDLLSRIGGEEFLIALPDTDLREARFIAQRLCKTVSRTPFQVPGVDRPITVTISIGLTMGRTDLDQAEQIEPLLDRADRALYAAKRHGRNQVTLGRTAA
ncbi:MAG: diguanylate cyclase domain-containing protein [Paracoccaceae bacterium]